MTFYEATHPCHGSNVPKFKSGTFHSHQAQLIDQGLHRKISDEEYEAAKLLDPHSNWCDVPAEDIDACDAALSHISPEGWRFYIPAYMKRGIELVDKPIWQNNVTGWMLFHLTFPAKDLSMQHYVLDRFKLLDEEQVLAVVAVLTFLANYVSSETDWRKDAMIALQSYWGLDRQARPTLSIILDKEPSALRSLLALSGFFTHAGYLLHCQRM